MRKTIFFFISIFSLIISGAVSAQQTIEQRWLLPELNCRLNTGPCLIHLSLEGDLYTYVSSDATLYFSRENQGTYTSYDLSLYREELQGVLTDFLAFSNHKTVIFYSDRVKSLIKINLETADIEIMPQSRIHNLRHCNPYQARVGSEQYISRIGLDNLLLACAVAESGSMQILVIDVVNNVTIKIINMENSGLEETTMVWGSGGINPPWRRLIGGQDGNLYIDYGYVFPYPRGLINSTTPDDIWGWEIFRYDNLSNNWAKYSISPRDFMTINYPPDPDIDVLRMPRLEAVTQNGGFIYTYSWKLLDEETSQEYYHVDINYYDENFTFIKNHTIKCQMQNGFVTLIGLTSNEDILFRNGNPFQFTLLDD